MNKTRLNFEVFVSESDWSAFHERCRQQGITDPTVRLNKSVTQAVQAAIMPPVGLPALHDEGGKLENRS